MNKHRIPLVAALFLMCCPDAGASPTYPSLTATRQAIDRLVCGSVTGSNFAALEDLAAQFRTRKHPLSKFPWAPDEYYAAFQKGDCEKVLSDNAAVDLFLDRWDREKPGSTTARLVRANLFQLRGSHARGGGYASTVSEKGWDEYRRWMQQSAAVLADLQKQRADDTYLYTMLINVGRALSLPKERLHEFFAEGVRRDPSRWTLYAELSLALEEKWGGEAGDVEKFADEVLQKDYGKHGKVLYAKIAAWKASSCRMNQFTTDFHFAWDKIQEGYRQWLSEGFATRADLHQFARLAVEFGDQNVAQEVFQLLGSDWDEDAKDVWRKTETFAAWQRWAKSGGQAPGLQEIHRAAIAGDAAKLQELSDKHVDVNAVDGSGKTALHFALERGQSQAAHFLILHGAEVNRKARSGDTPLHSAVMFGNALLTQDLLSNGANPLIMNRDGRVPFHLAAMNGFLPILQLLRSKTTSFSPNVRDAEGRTALHLASAHGHRHVVDALLRIPGVDAGVKDQWLYTPLHMACSYGDLETVKLLVAGGGDVNAADMEGRTPLTFAVKKGARDVVDFLRAHGGR